MIMVELSSADTKLVEAGALAGNMSVEEFSHAAIMKAARNAAYTAKLDRAFQNMRERKNMVSFTEEEWERFVHEQEKR